jgi:hypothetical protein
MGTADPGHECEQPHGVSDLPRDANGYWGRLDYAMNRYYAAQWGRFTTPDPYQASAR